MQFRETYIEILIQLIELNEDKTWLSYFHNLRNGGYLPGGGAGSLNDWGPHYADETQDIWYTNLYTLIRFLYDNNYMPAKIDELNLVKENNQLTIIQCVNCTNRYQHPSIFESHIAIHFYHSFFINSTNELNYSALFLPKTTFNHPKVNEYRDQLNSQYELHKIKIYDFIKGQYSCPYCHILSGEINHLHYTIDKTGNKIDSLIKPLN